MKVYEVISLAGGLMKTLHENGINTNDYKWLDLYRDYLKMKAEGLKKTYIVAILSGRYSVCERKVYNVIGEMERDCTIGAV